MEAWNDAGIEGENRSNAGSFCIKSGKSTNFGQIKAKRYMTLITNEIHLVNGFQESFMIATADRRLTFDAPKSRKEKYKSGRKLFQIKYLNATVSYWGNFYLTDGGRLFEYSEWLPIFITKNHDIKTLPDFASALRDRLNKTVRAGDMRLRASGFHLAGYSVDGIPEFYHFSNCKWNNTKQVYEDLEFVYKSPSADYLEKDALKFGWNGSSNSMSNVKARTTYRNGDFKVHEVAWEKIDAILAELFTDNAFKKMATLHSGDLKKYIHFKLRFIGSVYKHFSHIENVGGPFDIAILKPNSSTSISSFDTVFL